MVQAGEDFGFALEPRQPLRVTCQRRRKNLDCDLALQLRVRCTKHLAHAAFADARADFVDTEAGAWSESQAAGSIRRAGAIVSLKRTSFPPFFSNSTSTTRAASTP